MNKLFKNRTFGVILLAALVIILSVEFILKRGSVVRTPPTGDVTLTENFPQAPVYPNSSLISSNNGSGEGGFLYEATWETDDSVPKVSTWYLDQFESMPDWTVYAPPADTSVEDIQLLVVTREELIYNFSFIKDTSSGKTQIISEILSQAQIEEEGEGETE